MKNVFSYAMIEEWLKKQRRKPTYARKRPQNGHQGNRFPVPKRKIQPLL